MMQSLYVRQNLIWRILKDSDDDYFLMECSIIVLCERKLKNIYIYVCVLPQRKGVPAW